MRSWYWLHNIVNAVNTVLKQLKWVSQVALVVKNLPVHAGDIRDKGSISGSRRSPGEGHGPPLQYSCLENSMAKGASWATVHRITKNRTTEATEQAHTCYHIFYHNKKKFT